MIRSTIDGKPRFIVGFRGKPAESLFCAKRSYPRWGTEMEARQYLATCQKKFGKYFHHFVADVDTGLVVFSDSPADIPTYTQLEILDEPRRVA